MLSGCRWQIAFLHSSNFFSIALHIVYYLFLPFTISLPSLDWHFLLSILLTHSFVHIYFHYFFASVFPISPMFVIWNFNQLFPSFFCALSRHSCCSCQATPKHCTPAASRHTHMSIHLTWFIWSDLINFHVLYFLCWFISLSRIVFGSRTVANGMHCSLGPLSLLSAFTQIRTPVFMPPNDVYFQPFKESIVYFSRRGDGERLVQNVLTHSLTRSHQLGLARGFHQKETIFHLPSARKAKTCVCALCEHSHLAAIITLFPLTGR